MNKDIVLDAVNDLPQDFELEILLEKLVFIEKVQKGLDQLKEGRTVTHDEVKRRIKTWRK